MPKLDYESPRPPKPWLSDREKLFLAFFFLFVTGVVLIVVVMVLPH